MVLPKVDRRAKYFLLLLAYIGITVFTAECLIYYIVMWRCVWPNSNGNSEHAFGQVGDSEWIFRERESGNGLPRSSGPNVRENRGLESVPPWTRPNSDESLRTFFIADTHLLGSRLGHWFDKLRREWQMERAFQAAMMLLAPEAVFILGDLTDEGKWASDAEFHATTSRFQKIFSHPSSVHFKVVVGNHDVGFHNFMSQHKLKRFMDAFSSRGVEVVTLKNISFVLVNSMAFHGDSCDICLKAEKKLHRLSQQLNCSRFGSKDGVSPQSACDQKLPSTPPILLQHFPLYRPSDEKCDGVDGTPLEEKYIPHGEGREVISRASTDKLLWWLQPRLVLSAHTHHGCYIVHSNKTPEISVPSFSWRNRKNPSIVMATITPTSIAINKCFLPEETLVINIYAGSGIVLMIWVIWSFICSIRKWSEKHIKDL